MGWGARRAGCFSGNCCREIHTQGRPEPALGLGELSPLEPGRAMSGQGKEAAAPSRCYGNHTQLWPGVHHVVALGKCALLPPY